MAEFLLELFSEEIPARMQALAARELQSIIWSVFSTQITPVLCHGPRRIALHAVVPDATNVVETIERGPRRSAPEQALAGFLRKHQAARESLHAEGDYWVLRHTTPARPMASHITEALPPLLRRFPWPKSMRWGGSGNFTWVRPLRRILCLLDGMVVPFSIEEAGLSAGELTEGHRVLAQGAFAVRNAADWREGLRARFVLVDAGERRARIAEGLAGLAAARGLRVVEDSGLLDEVAGLVEWPVPLLGRIDADFMTLPPEVRQVSMRVNQRYFALCDAAGDPAPWFGFAANIEGEDGGAAIIAGNERVLRARLADARHFWDADRRVRLEDRLPALERVVFHAKLGSQHRRRVRLETLAGYIARQIGADELLARRAATLAKADLTSAMVGEFPELQGIMGRYYALHDQEDPAVAAAIADHYKPRGPDEAVPTELVTLAAALADKLDTLAGFFAIGEEPTGSGDPYGLRRAALGIIRIVLENTLRFNLIESVRYFRQTSGTVFYPGPDRSGDVLAFIVERMTRYLMDQGTRGDVLKAVYARDPNDDRLFAMVERVRAIQSSMATAEFVNLLAGYRRAANILRIEQSREQPGVFDDDPDPALFQTFEETSLANNLAGAGSLIGRHLGWNDFAAAMAAMAALRAPLDAFFAAVMVNAPEPALRRNRLRLLRQVRDTMNRIADFSQIVDG